MVVFVIYNIVMSILLIIFSIYFIRQINEDIKKDEEDNKYYNSDRINKGIKASKIFKLLNYIVLVFSVLIILFTIFIFIIKIMEVL